MDNRDFNQQRNMDGNSNPTGGAGGRYPGPQPDPDKGWPGNEGRPDNEGRPNNEGRQGNGRNRFWAGVLAGALVTAFVGLIVVGMSAGIYIFGKKVLNHQPGTQTEEALGCTQK